MRQDRWVDRTLSRYAFVIYVCHQCSRHYFSTVAFVSHLVRDHGENEPCLLRFLQRDSDEVKFASPNQTLDDPKVPSASF